MRITPNHIAIGRIFEQNFLFEVPKYQRYFAWDDEQVTDFIRDIDNILLNSVPQNPVEHFFGGIVCASKVVEGSTRQQKELIDGQQRITTTILLIVNIIRAYTQLKENPDATPDDNDIMEKRISGLKRTYLFYDDEINRKPKTVHKLVLSLADKARDNYEIRLKKQSINDISARALLAFNELQHILYQKSIRTVEEGFRQCFASLINKSDCRYLARQNQKAHPAS